ncbi:hypothetical protein [Actinacidiphila glaucinigra]|uniref:hypothetical protein n=1 Tax=Actinacidiphila glaucinigra TaxID=235986 RepID=UPI0029B3400B|nr:hypothetical protein [Streptomyces sp. PA03-3a]
MTGPITPRLTPIPVDGTTPCGRIAADAAQPCAEPARWHIQWLPGHGSFACAAHMVEARRLFAYVDRHQVGPDCNMPGALWAAGRCAVPRGQARAA